MCSTSVWLLVAIWAHPGSPDGHTATKPAKIVEIPRILDTFRPINRANMGGFQIFLHFLGGNFSLHLHINYLGPPVNYGPFQEGFRA